MAREVYAFAVTIPAGTLPTAPYSPNMAMPPRRIEALEILVPPGPRGEVGFSIGAAGVPVLPRGSNSWLITDDERIVWPLDHAIDSGAWQFFGYNTGTNPHTIYIRFLVQLTTDAAPTDFGLFSAAALAADSTLAPAASPAVPALAAIAAPGSADQPTLASVGFTAGA